MSVNEKAEVQLPQVIVALHDRITQQHAWPEAPEKDNPPKARRIEEEAAALLKLLQGERARMEALRNALIVHLAAQETVEQRFNELLRLTRDALALLLACPIETPPPAIWIQRRDTLMQHLACFLDEGAQRQKGHP